VFIFINLNRYLSLQNQADDAGPDILFGPTVTRRAVAGGQLFQYGLVPDYFEQIPFFVCDRNGKTGSGNKLVEFLDLGNGNL